MKFKTILFSEIEKEIAATTTEGLYINFFHLSKSLADGTAASEEKHGEDFDGWCRGCQMTFDSHVDALDRIAAEVEARRSGVPAGTTTH